MSTSNPGTMRRPGRAPRKVPGPGARRNSGAAVAAPASPENTGAPPPSPAFIHVRGARQNNLKNLDLRLPLNQLTVITG